MTAEITDQTFGRTITAPGRPVVLIKHSAVLECGCACHVGIRTDNREAATVAHPCTREHVGLIEHFNLLLRESLAARHGADLLVNVVRDLLDETERHWR